MECTEPHGADVDGNHRAQTGLHFFGSFVGKRYRHNAVYAGTVRFAETMRYAWNRVRAFYSRARQNEGGLRQPGYNGGVVRGLSLAGGWGRIRWET